MDQQINYYNPKDSNLRHEPCVIYVHVERAKYTYLKCEFYNEHGKYVIAQTQAIEFVKV